MNHIKLDIQNEPTGQTVPLNASILYQCQRRLSIFFNRKLHFFRIFHRACRKSGDTPPSAQGAGQRCYPFALRDLSAPECGVSLTHLPVPVPDGSYARQYLCRSVLMSVCIHVSLYSCRSVFTPVLMPVVQSLYPSGFICCHLQLSAHISSTVRLAFQPSVFSAFSGSA